MKNKITTLIVILVVAVIIASQSFFYTTYENQYSVVKQFGKIVQTNSTAGLRTKIPFAIQN